MPQWMLYLKIVILFLSLVILAVSAYGLSLTSGVYYGYGYYGYSGAPGYMLFIAIKTMLIFGAAVAVEFMAPHFFYRILALIAYLISVLFWLSGWAWSASWAGAWCGLDRDGCGTYGGVLAAIAALGAVVWVLSIVHLVFFVKFCKASPDTTAHGGAELGHVKPEQPYVAAQHSTGQPAAAQYPGAQYPQPQQQQAYPQQPQQHYPQQQQPYQQ